MLTIYKTIKLYKPNTDKKELLMAKWLATGQYLVVLVGEKRPITLQVGTDKYNTIHPLLVNGTSDDEILRLLDTGSKIEEYSEGAIKVDTDSGIVTIDDTEVHDSITDRIVEFCRKDIPYLPLLAFWRNIQENPSAESKRHLFLFLEANKMPITTDGCFIAYKVVNYNKTRDLVDCYTGNFCNNVGSVVTMDRENVNPDRDTTCSRGLHVAAYEYVKDNFSGNVIVEVKVNPRDVVAVPTDYNNQKMRVCRYEVMSINIGKQIDVDKTPYIDTTLERSKKKHSKKTQKSEKSNFNREKRQKEIQARERMIADLKETKTGSVIRISEIESLTAKEIIEVTYSLTEIAIELSLKNKKAIVKKAIKLLETAEYILK